MYFLVRQSFAHIYVTVFVLDKQAEISKGVATQQTFQRRFNVVFRLIWRCDVTQRQINVKTKLGTSTLKFTTLNNVETTLYFSTLNWTTLEKVEATLSFSTSIFRTLGNVKTTLRIWPFEKKINPWFKNKIILSFKKYAGLKEYAGFSSFFPILRGICKRTFTEPQKFIKE